MIDKSKMVIWINLRYYAELNLQPTLNDKDVYVNECLLIDSETKKAVEGIAFNSDWLIPILEKKDTARFKEVGEKIRALAVKNGVLPVSASAMPKGTKQKGKLYEKKA